MQRVTLGGSLQFTEPGHGQRETTAFGQSYTARVRFCAWERGLAVFRKRTGRVTQSVVQTRPRRTNGFLVESSGQPELSEEIRQSLVFAGVTTK